jgi:hypothetical protein
MKRHSTALFFQGVLLLATTTTFLASGEGEDHSDHGDGLLDQVCSELNVTDTVSCEDWCGPSLMSEWTSVTEHGHFEEFHLAYLVGWMCHCTPQTTTAAAQTTGDDTNSTTTEDEEKHCEEAVEIPTCYAMGLADCGANATSSCGELCDAMGLGAGGNTPDARSLRVLAQTSGSDDHYCAHHDDADHVDRRTLHEGEHGDGFVTGVTLCYCNSPEENAEGSTVVCADADLTQEEATTVSGGWAMSIASWMVGAVILLVATM